MIEIHKEFESSDRVKGLTFHPSRPFLCASLYNGVIQIWDYENDDILEEWEPHGESLPVEYTDAAAPDNDESLPLRLKAIRSVDFHLTKPYIVSGGDDYKVNIWDYEEHISYNTFHGHLDFVRKVQFHPNVQFSWILSASDDATVRIWDFQHITCLAVLMGHFQEVMCASFHPTKYLILSASCDFSIKVWDYSMLQDKYLSGTYTGIRTLDTGVVSALDFGEETPGCLSKLYQHCSKAYLTFTETTWDDGVIEKFTLHGHTKMINWASFHPNSDWIVSGADDGELKLWQLDNETKTWEMHSMTGHHTHDITCCLFHPTIEQLLMSCSMDGSVQVWDISNKETIDTVQKCDGNRFWKLVVHPSQNLVAAAHDLGMMIFTVKAYTPGQEMFSS